MFSILFALLVFCGFEDGSTSIQLVTVPVASVCTSTICQNVPSGVHFESPFRYTGETAVYTSHPLAPVAQLHSDSPINEHFLTADNAVMTYERYVTLHAQYTPNNLYPLLERGLPELSYTAQLGYLIASSSN